MSSPGGASSAFPLHVLVWNNDYRRLDEELRDQDVDQRDPRGRTLLHLAVSLGYLESAKVLLQHKADVTKENAQGWTVLHEAVSTGDPEMVQLILQHRDYQQTSMTLGGVPELLQKINETPDFYVEMKWEFTSWVPLVSRVCPSDVCRIWKSRAKLRVDITLLGFENMSWERGRRTVIFKGEDTGGWAELIEINHDEKFVTTERFEISQHMKRLTLGSMTPKRKDVERRLTTPIISTCLDTKNIAFERTTSGFWVWKTEKSEGINGYEAKVYMANNVNVITRIRTEHLTEEEKKRYKADRSPLESFLGTVEHECGVQSTSRTTEYAATNNPTAITLEEYFDPDFDLKGRDIGRPKEVTVRTQKFKATLWMSEEFPLSLMEQVTPIIDLMARTSAHFARLKDFITLEFPPGFPVKIGANFEVDQSVFEIPKSYHIQDDGRNIHVQDEDNEIMQFAIQQSLLESGPNKVSAGICAVAAWARAVQQESGNSHSSSSSETSSFEKDLQLAMELSVREQEEQEKQRREKEDAELQQVLQLSLVEK
uniref:Ankyrin repeat domain 13A n=1 Tax=Catharus ustulatus TaxID=91951 RepID=A0A8C3VCZ3_CATUS